MSATVTLHVDSPQGGQVLRAPAGEQTPTLAIILRRQGLPLNTRCGERGLCDGCVVELRQGALVHVASGRRVTAQAEAPVMLRGCEHRLAGGCAEGEVHIHLPARSLLAHEPKVLAEFKLNVPCAHDPLLEKATLGAAIDIGTTTVAVMVVDLATGRVVGQASSFNRQMHLGDDVVTRINLCQVDPAMLGQLQKEVVGHTLAPLLQQALRHARQAGALPPGVGEDGAGALAGAVIAGNTTMLHLLAGVDPTPMGVAPFTPVFLEHRELTGAQVGLHLTAGSAGSSPAVGATPQVRDMALHLLPGASAYVGSDLMAGLVASGLAYDDGPSLLVDVGTNGEILFKHGDRILGTATAAGPAFEGARLISGIRAGRGAISAIALERDPFAIRTRVIGDERAIGICGSGYIDFLSQAREIGLLTPAGRFDLEAAPGARDSCRFHDDHVWGLVLAHGRGNQDILVAETDVASLLQAKAAIAAGILTLLDTAGVKPADIKTLYLAGGFGTHMNPRHAIGCGLLPEFVPGQIQVVGNSALAGAYLALMDRSALAEMARLARRVEIVELNLVPGFEDRYVDQLLLP